MRRITTHAAGAMSALLLALLLALPATAQQRLPTYPNHDAWTAYSARAGELRALANRGLVNGSWTDDGMFVFERAGERLAWQPGVGVGPAPAPGGEDAARGGPRPERGRQYTEAEAPDGSAVAVYRDRNVVVRHADGREVAVTSAGSEVDRTKFGTGSWVYGEELGQVTAMWWSPDASMLAFYGFDESGVQDYYLQLDQTKIQSTVDVEAYPKAGTDNPVVSLHVWNAGTGRVVELDVRSGQPFDPATVGYYVYAVEWTPAGDEVLIHRTNRWQNVLELAACTPSDGTCRTVLREEWPTGWVENTPERMWLADGRRFVWVTESSGYRNYELRDLDGQLITRLTDHPFEVEGIQRLDEEAGWMWYLARSGDNHMKMQLHRVRLDGSGDMRLTDPALHHSVRISPDGEHFVDVAQAHDLPPFTHVRDAEGNPVAELAAAADFHAETGLRPVELFEFTAADGTSPLHGMLHYPADFDPTGSYPLLVSVYAGPATNGARETFTTPHPYTALGFAVLTLDARSAAGRGKRALDAIYLKLGVVEIDDLAAGTAAAAERPWIDGRRVGIFGTSYGGYASIMAILRHPGVFAAASASSPVTDWRHYDTIYTERYMRTPQANPEGYDAGSAMPYVDALEGDLMLYYGTADNNVHPSNMMEFIAALQQAGKSFEVQVGPDRGHTAIPAPRMLEFFVETLVLDR